MPITITCPSCARTLRVPDGLLGKKVKCPSCATAFQASAGSEAEPQHNVYADEGAPLPSKRVPAAPERDHSDPDDDFEDEPRPSKRSRRMERPDTQYYDDERPTRYRSNQKPGKVQAIAIMTLIGGILA